MIVATLLVAIGLLVGAWAATTRGYRLSGVVVVSLLAIYTLVDFAALPVFVASALLAYLGIQVVQDRWLVYGRPLLLIAMLVGAVLPVFAFVVGDLVLGRSIVVREIDYLGSILPGIAAYNYYREDADRLLPEVVASAALFVGLLVAGVLSLLLWSRPPCTTCQLLGVSPADYAAPILLSPGSDVAGLFGLSTVAAPASVGSLGAVTAVVLLGLIVGEVLRERWGLQPAGVIALPLVALFALRAWWVLPLYVVVGLLTFVVIGAVHRWTLLYGRALLSIATVLGVFFAVPALVGFGLTDNVAVFFAGLLGGIGAYNLHRVAPADRLAATTVNAGSFVAIFALARALVAPRPGGLAESVGWGEGAIGALAILAAVWVLAQYERTRPSERALRARGAAGREVAR